MKALKLKLDENGHVIIQDGKPVYIYEDGKEAPFDVNAAMQKIADLNEESKNRRLKIDELMTGIDRYKDSEGNYLDPDVAFKAIETVKNYSDKEMYDAAQVDSLKAQMNKAFTEKMDTLVKNHNAEKADLTKHISNKDAAIFKLLVKDRFSTSKFVNDKLAIPSEIVADYFGGHFKVEGEPENLRVVGYVGDEKILSRERPGTPADFEEAIEAIVDRYPMKDRIMRGTGPGTGSLGNTNQSSGYSRGNELKDLPPVERLKEARRRQMQAGGS